MNNKLDFRGCKRGCKIICTNFLEYTREGRTQDISKQYFPSDEALFKGVYLAIAEVTKKWTGKIKDWPLILSELAIYFEDRIGGYL